MIDNAANVPLPELLRHVPVDARILASTHGMPASAMAISSIPIGRYAHDAADEIDRLRAELAARGERIAGLEAALRTWNKAFSQIPCWARKWDAFREARSAAKAALDE